MSASLQNLGFSTSLHLDETLKRWYVLQTLRAFCENFVT